MYCITMEVPKNSQPTQPPIQWVPGALSLGMEQPGQETDQSPPSKANGKNEWANTCIPPICLHGMYRQLYLFMTSQ